MTTKDEELSIVEVRALRDMLEQTKKDLETVAEIFSTNTIFTNIEIANKVNDILKKYLPKGGTDAQKNTAT
jgi:hypothetical protein